MFGRLKGKLVVDVLSVKMYPRELLLRILPEEADILCTHPMFGPVSGAESWEGLPFMFDRVRVRDATRAACDAYVSIYEKEACRMVSMTCEQHDTEAASSQFLTHMTGKCSSIFLKNLKSLVHFHPSRLVFKGRW